MGLGIALVRASGLWAVRAAAAVATLLVLAQVPTLFSTPQLLAQEFNVLTPDYRNGMQNVFQYMTNNPGQAYSDKNSRPAGAGSQTPVEHRPVHANSRHAPRPLG